MLMSGWAARGIVAESWKSTHGTDPRALMVGPVPLSPFSRQVIVDAGDHYEYGTFSWSRRAVTLVPEKIPEERRRASGRRRTPRQQHPGISRLGPLSVLDHRAVAVRHARDGVRHALSGQKRICRLDDPARPSGI